MSFLRRVRAAWNYGRDFPYIPEADETWSESDAVVANSFFESGPGKRLAQRLRNYVVRSAISACQNPKGEHAAGVAAGIGMTAAFIDSHCITSPEPETEEQLQEQTA